MKIVHGKEDAFTGLEAAIVFIAFVVVAAVFSYIVLSAGFFTTQKSQEVIHAGVTEAVSNIVLDGDVYLTLPDGVSQVIQFDITPAAGNSPVDVDKLQIMMSTHNSTPQELSPNYLYGDLYPAPGYWSVYSRKPATKTNDLLNYGESVTLHVTPPATMVLTPRSQLIIELIPENGAALSIERTLPADISKITTILY